MHAKRAFLPFLLAAAVTTGLLAQSPSPDPVTLVTDPAHSSVSFRIRHLLSKVDGRFGGFSGTLTGDPAKPEGATMSFAIRADSIDTANADRDKHLRSADFFDVETFPEISFQSTRIVAKGGGLFDVHGRFSMHGVTKEVVLPVTFLGTMKDGWGNEKYGFSLETMVNRKDFGVSWNKILDQGGTVLGDTVEVTIDLQMMRKAPEKG
jgi:polyisoprenoid-binding protein YceI